MSGRARAKSHARARRPAAAHAPGLGHPTEGAQAREREGHRERVRAHIRARAALRGAEIMRSNPGHETRAVRPSAPPLPTQPAADGTVTHNAMKRKQHDAMQRNGLQCSALL